MANIELSIVIPTINRYEDLDNTLTDLSKQSYTNFEILVIDQSDSPQIITTPKTRHLHISSKSASKARNIGLLEAKSDVVLFLDDDVIIENKDFLKNHLRPFEDKKIAGVTGPILAPGQQMAYELPKSVSKKHIGWMFFPRNYGKQTAVPNGGSGNLSVRRNLAIQVGGMDERYQKGAFREESDFCLRYTSLYGDLIYNPDCSLIHIGNDSGGSRSWEVSQGMVHGYHHMFGGWYFMFRRLPFSTWPITSYSLLRRHVLHRKLMRKAVFLPKALFYFTKAMVSACYFSLLPPKMIKSSYPETIKL